jgi:carboxyl-terminal processing protease
LRFLIKCNLIALFLLFSPLCAIIEDLRYSDVCSIMEEMMRYHIEHKELSPLLAQRSLNLFIQQFDNDKVYFLQNEIDPFLSCPSKKIYKMIKNCRNGDFCDFWQLNRAICDAVVRARTLRLEVERELILSSRFEEVSAGETYLDYPKSIEELKERMRKRALRFLLEEKKHARRGSWTPSLRSKIFTLYEKKIHRIENTYLDQKSKIQVMNKPSQEHWLCLHILKAFAKSLDAHSYYFSSEEAIQMRAGLIKQFEGFGIMLRETVDGVMISGIVKGSSAALSGKIATGDIIEEINGNRADEIGYEEMLGILKKGGEEKVHLKLRRILPGEEEVLSNVTLKRAQVPLTDDRLHTTLEPFGNGVIAKFDLGSFYESSDGASSEKDLKDAMSAIQSKYRLLGVILDLRNNSGGFLNQAVKVAGLFIKSGVVVISKYAGGELKYLRVTEPHAHFQGPLIILTSKASASAAEIVAQALQDYGVALIVGDKRTYGKGSIQYQTVTDLSARAYYKVTVGKYYTVSGKSAQIEGVQADIFVPTAHSFHKIGEEFLEYPLKNDKVPAAYTDSLADIDPKMKGWFEKNYLPYLQQKTDLYTRLIPMLEANSIYRLKHDANYTLFREGMSKHFSSIETGKPFRLGAKNNWGVEDLQIIEGTNLMKDLIYTGSTSKAPKI